MAEKAKTPMVFPASDQLKEAITEAATKRKWTKARLIREAIAVFINYDLSSEPKSGRPKTYENAEARKAANSAKAKQRRELINKLVLAAQRGDREDDIDALLDSLAKATKIK